MLKNIKIFILICIAMLLIAFIPLFIDWVIIGNSFPSNISNSDWISFLGGYIGVIIGSIVSLVGIMVTIHFTREQIQMTKAQFEEQKRLNNIPVLDCEIIDITNDVDSDAITMDCEYTLKNEEEFCTITAAFNIYNIGLGAAIDLKYGMKVNGKEQDGVFWISENRTLRNQTSIIQKITFFIPKNMNFKPELLVFYEDILENRYCKSINIITNCSDFPNNVVFFIKGQDKGELCKDVKNDKLYYVAKSIEFADNTQGELK